MPNVTEHFRTIPGRVDDKTAQKWRNARARELRKAGFTVWSHTWDFTDLARCRDYTVSYGFPNAPALPQAPCPEGPKGA